MLDFNHIYNDPTVNLQKFFGSLTTTGTNTINNWQTWVKPRGIKMVYMIAAGGGSSGGSGLNTGGTSGGGAGGTSGAQTTLLIPAMFLPDVLYIQAGLGGSQPATITSAATGVAGTATSVTFEPNYYANTCVLFANGGTASGAAATTTAGGVSLSSLPVAATVSNMFYAGLGAYTAVGTSGIVLNITTAITTGLMIIGGSGGGGCNGTTASAGGTMNGVGLGDNYPTVVGGYAAVSATPAGNGSAGRIVKPWFHYGGSGGGGGTNVSGVRPGDGGPGAPGCGGGGSGGSTNIAGANILARPGDGGPGFVYIYSW